MEGNEEQLYHMSTGTPSHQDWSWSWQSISPHPFHHPLKNHTFTEDVCAHTLQDLC